VLYDLSWLDIIGLILLPSSSALVAGPGCNHFLPFHVLLLLP
jgi:hypothetical protein